MDATGATATAAAALTAQRADGGAETHIGADQEAATAGAMTDAAAASLPHDSVQTRGETSADNTMGAAAPINQKPKEQLGSGNPHQRQSTTKQSPGDYDGAPLDL